MNQTRTLICVLALALLALPVAAEGTDRDEVLASIQTFFDAMESKDADRALSVMLPEGRFHSVREENGEEIVRTFTNREFIDGLSNGSEALLERMWDSDVRIHGAIASVWTPYDFHRDGVFSHCGIDIFTLVKTDKGWMISGGAYTVERTGCEESPLGPPQSE